MIRYVLAVALAVALLAVAAPASEYAATANTDRYVSAAMTDLEDAAATLVADEERPPPGQPPPQRAVTLSLPPDSTLTQPVALEIQRLDANRSLATIDFGGAERTHLLEVPLAGLDDSGAVDLSGPVLELEGTGDRAVVLHLETGEQGEPVVVVGAGR